MTMRSSCLSDIVTGWVAGSTERFNPMAADSGEIQKKKGLLFADSLAIAWLYTSVLSSPLVWQQR